MVRQGRVVEDLIYSAILPATIFFVGDFLTGLVFACFVGDLEADFFELIWTVYCR